MSEKVPKRFLPHRHAHDAALRVYESMSVYSDINPVPVEGDPWLPQTYYRLEPLDRASAVAELIVRRPSGRFSREGEASSTTNARVGHFEMGHYDPARQQWIVYDDVVSSFGEREQLEAHFEQLSQIERAMLEVEALPEAGETFFDYRHPGTEEARKQTRTLLARSGLLTGLITHHPDNAVRNKFAVDHCSAAFLSIVPLDAGQAREEVLQANYRGLAYPDPQKIGRRTLTLPLAKRIGGPGAEWHPNKSLMRQSHWEDHLLLGAELLEAQQKRYPQFSMARCAIVQSQRTVWGLAT